MPKPLPLFLLSGFALLLSCGKTTQPGAPDDSAPPAVAESAAAPTVDPLVEAEDHVVLLGNGLADRMQHDGWLESYLQCSFPDLHLVIRNHGYTGDRIDKRPANAAVTLGNGDAERTEIGQPGRDIPGEFRAHGTGNGILGQLFPGEMRN